MSKRPRTSRYGYGGVADQVMAGDYGSGAPLLGGASVQPSWLSSMPTVTPESMIINHPVKNPSILRSNKRLQAQETRYATNGNNIITYDFPNSKPIDFRKGYLMFDLVITTTGGTYKRLAQGAWCFINKIRIIFGSMEDEIQYYNRLYSFLWNRGVDADVQATIGMDLLGVGTQAQRNAFGASATGTSYVVPFYHGMFRQGIIPMNALSTGTNGQLLRVEFTMDNPLNFVETDGLNPQVFLNNLRWHYTEISSPDLAFEREMIRLVQSGSYKIGYETWSVYQNPVITSAPDLIIQWKGSALNEIVSIFVDGNSLANTLVNDKFTTWRKNLPNPPGPDVLLLSYQHCVNEVWMPVEAVDCTGNAYRAYMEYLEDMGLWSLDGFVLFAAPIELDTFNLDQFMITLNLRSVPTCITDNSEHFNNISTSTSTSNTLLRLQFGAPPPVQTVIFHMVSNNVLLCATPNGTLVKKW